MESNGSKLYLGKHLVEASVSARSLAGKINQALNVKIIYARHY